MKKMNIIKENKDFEEIINTKKNYRNTYFSIYIRKNNLIIPRFGISVPKKVGIAVVRNKVKRQIKDILDKTNILIGKNTDYVIIARNTVLELKYNELKLTLEELLNKIGKDTPS